MNRKMKSSFHLYIFNFIPILSSFGQVISTIAGNGNGTNSCTVGDGGSANSAMVWIPESITIDNLLNIYIGDYGNGRIREINSSNIITTIAGGCGPSLPNDGGPSTNSWIGSPQGLIYGASGNLYISAVNSTIRKINSLGIINTIAGTGSTGYSGDGGLAVNAQINWPQGLVEYAGDLYFSDSYNHRIRKITTSTGIITTIAGTGVQGFSGDGSSAISAQFNFPTGLVFDPSGNLFILDKNNQRIRKINTSGVISTIAGTGIGGYSGDGGIATLANINNPNDIALDLIGNIYFSDQSNQRIRKINPSGIITTAVGTGSFGFSGDGGNPISASLNNPTGITFDSFGNLYIADMGNNRIRKVTYNSTTVNDRKKLIDDLTIYPNPSNGSFKLQIDTEIKEGEIILMNSLGQKVHEQKITKGENEINTNGLAKGLYYYLLLENNEQISNGKIAIE